jgi:hypothetical protein
MQSQTGAHLRFALISFFTLSLVVALSCGSQAVAQTGVSNDSVFGPNVYVIDPSATEATVEATLASLANLQQFDTNRYAVLFKPGAYTIQNQTGAFGYVGYYESIAGLGRSPGDVTINGFLLPNQSTALGNSNETQTFWRSMENLTFNPTTSQEAFWGVSQGTALRRIQVNGRLRHLGLKAAASSLIRGSQGMSILPGNSGLRATASSAVGPAAVSTWFSLGWPVRHFRTFSVATTLPYSQSQM